MEGQWFDRACHIGDNTALSPFSTLEIRGKEARAECEDSLLTATWTAARPRFMELKTSRTKDDSAHFSLQTTRTEAMKIRFDGFKKNKVGNVRIM
jgi:hypothetical protein